MNSFSPINYQYGNCIVPSDVNNRNSLPSSDTYGNGVDYKNCLYDGSSVEKIIYPDNYLLKNSYQTINKSLIDNNTNEINNQKNQYILLASDALGYKPDMIMSVYFSDANIAHIQNVIVTKIKEITGDSQLFGTPEGLTIQNPNMTDLFNYLLKVYRDYKVYNGSICFVNNEYNVKNELTKLNSNVIQDYVSKMISQLNMYVYYYKDASRIPEQLSLPVFTS